MMLKSSFIHAGMRMLVTRGVLPRLYGRLSGDAFTAATWSMKAGFAVPLWYAAAEFVSEPLKKLFVVGSLPLAVLNG